MEQLQQPQPIQVPPQQPPTSDQSERMKVALLALGIVVVVIGAYLLFTRYSSAPATVEEDVSAEASGGAVQVEVTPLVAGKMQPPAGFPSGIPYEPSGITESSTTNFPEQGTRQLALAYTSSKPVAEVYNEYLSYARQAGYQVSEGKTPPSIKAFFGTSEAANLSVVVSSQDEGTLVQLSYLVLGQ